jgi:diguanylate cyclase
VQGAARARPRTVSAYAVVVSMALLGLLGGTLLPGRPMFARHAVSDAAFVLAPALATWQCLRSARDPGATRRVWLLLGAASGAWALGSVAWAVDELVLGRLAPFPSVAHVFYLAYPVLALLGLLALPWLPTARASRARLVLDGVVVASAFLVIAWIGTLGNLGRAHGDPVASLLALAFPVLDVLTAAVVVVVLDRVRGGWRHPGSLAALGVAGVAMTDGLYAALAGAGSYATGGPLDVAWPLSFALIGFAARRPVTAGPDAIRVSHRLLPWLPAAVAAAALVASGRLLHGLDPVLAALTLALAAALVARQQLLAAENAALHASLEDRVRERTEELLLSRDRERRRARTDALTGLPNREALTEQLSAAVAAVRPGHLLGVVLLDLDGFKQVNDGFGHDAGDVLLQAAAGRLRSAVRDDAVLARMGGDEFAVLLPGLRSPSDAESVARRLLAALAPPLLVGPLEVVLGASAGTAVAESADVVAVHLLRDADTAMYAAKESGNGVTAFAPGMHVAVRERLELEADLRVALREGQLQVHYQPVVDLAADRVAGFEALARWTHPLRGAVSPADFVPAAERSGLVVELERLVLDVACAQLVQWRRTSPALTVAVNVSARHLRERDYLDTVLSALVRHSLPPAALVLEVTESLLFHDDDDVREVLERLHTAGIGLALDDFGTGYSSLSRLASYPFDTLKIDRAFVSSLDADPTAPVLVATLALARGLGMSVVAEGVETEAQLDFLRTQGCEHAQGYLLSRPGPAALVAGVIGRSLLPAPRSASDQSVAGT